jgi:hypothetical protein
MRVHLPASPGSYSSQFFNELVQQLQRAFGLAVSRDEETPRIVLRSPDGTNYDVTVSNAGALVVTPSVKTHV